MTNPLNVPILKLVIADPRTHINWRGVVGISRCGWIPGYTSEGAY